MSGGSQEMPWRSKTFTKKTRRGKVLRVVKEHYLRDDLTVPCELQSAAEAAFNGGSTIRLSAQPFAGEYLVLDTNVALNQMDLLEHPCPALSNVIVLQTVWEEVKHRDLGLYNRLAALMKEDKRRFVPFSNEHHRETYVVENAGESPNDRNDRAIRVFTRWYQEQLLALVDSGMEIDEGGEGGGVEVGRSSDAVCVSDVPKVVMLSNDRANCELARADKVPARTIHEHVQAVEKDYPELVDMLAAGGDNVVPGGTGGGKMLYRKHLPLSQIQTAVKAGRLFQGVLRPDIHSWVDCTVNVRSAGSDQVTVLISGREAINRAMDGDIVAIELLPRAQWRKPTDRMGEAADDGGGAGSGEGEDDEQDRVGVAPLTAAPEPDQRAGNAATPCGRVVGIIQRNWRHYCGSIDPEEGKALVSSALFVPVEKKVPKIRLRTKQRAALVGQRIIVKIDAWPADSIFPHGHYVRTLGPIGDKKTETEVLLLEHDIPTREFSAKVIACLPPVDWTITEENSRGRRDLRHIPVMSIDPPGCKDIDDALHCIELPNGNLQCGVHIADVAHFVAAGCALDEEAMNRGTSTYLVEQRLDMLPGLLTETLCSLKGNVDRFAFSVMWEMTQDAEILNVDFHRSIIHSVAAMSYPQAQVLLDDPNINDIKATSVRNLNKVAKILRRKRMEAGALTLASPEVRFVLDSESQNPTDVQLYALKETNKLVEEFMLLANITVGKKILMHFPTFALLRRHPSPSRKQFDPLLKSAGTVGVDLCVDSSKELADSLDCAVLEDHPYFNKLLRIMATRCMKPAAYFCTGEFARQEFHHYGLAAPIYTHFTSPIRRYADVVVHRLLAAAIGLSPMPTYLADKTKVHDMCQNLNKRHLAAQHAGRSSVNLYTLLYFKEHPTVEEAMVMRVRSNGLVVLVPRFGIEGTVFLQPRGTSKDDDTESEFLHYDADAETLVHRESPGSVLTVFQPVKVHISVAQRPGMRQELVLTLRAPFAIAQDGSIEVGGAMEEDDEEEEDGAKVTGGAQKKRTVDGSAKGKRAAKRPKATKT